MRHTFPPGLFLGFDHETRILYSGRKHRRCGMTEQTAGSRFRLGVSAAEDWRMAVDGCLLQLMPLSDAANIGFVYISDRLADKRSEEHTSELQSLMRNSYAVFCLKKKKKTNKRNISI